ncbi:hypothetical protein TVAG_380840 [Trichomonas vaginalis G3]|uniref:Uncharacterized protein n=1 Tax=Trichomonas vaginalis (strain ATCC PRA-98 / G3) TaxID=412133 RepID=A2FUH2_TRIV3|nr:hypothetical protein TVAGG3_0615440 [Trichomonas vaginalis G3]EAX91437.1 hypothetical protein TVAG_380840 [Trichomonas vaginalis G3]KAI5503517.1 hypothetical protein TVAGG3_0615440 [Trichomonas vaginalis G3]|eukprot:XP_001304367.1 hypothetical protein [Trichomonas vaginalis G3]
MSLSDKSKSLLDILDDLDDSDDMQVNNQFNVHQIAQSQDSRPHTPRGMRFRDDSIREAIFQQGKNSDGLSPPSERSTDWSQSFNGSPRAKTPPTNSLNKPNCIKSSASLSSFKKQDGKVLFTAELSPEQKRIHQLEFQISNYERQLLEESQIRELLLKSIQKFTQAYNEKCLNIKSSTIANIDTMISRLNLPNPKLSTARLLSQEIDGIVAEPTTEIKSPNSFIYSPIPSSKSPNIEILAKGCNDLADSLAKGFYDQKIKDFAELSKSPSEFSRQINLIIKAHENGLTELRSKQEESKKLAETIEQYENERRVTKETMILVDNLTKMMQDFSIQSREEYEDLIENIQ